MTGILVRDATEGDVNVALEVLRESIAKLCVADHNNEPATLHRWLSNKTPDQFLRWLSDQDRHVVVAVSGSEICGVGMVHRNGELELCYVRPGKERLGIGTAMMSALESQAKRWMLTKVLLISTVGARKFYERQGYTFINEGPAVSGRVVDYNYAKTIAAEV